MIKSNQMESKSFVKRFKLQSFELSKLSPDNPSNSNQHMQLFRSPYDVPEVMRAAYDSDRHKLQLDFQYTSPEPKMKTLELQPDLQFVIGTNSGNVYRIVVEIKSFQDVGYLEKKLGESLRQLEAKMPANSENYNVVAQVLRDKNDEFFPMVVGA